MPIHSNIGDDRFPVDVAAPNQIAVPYESYVLLPHLGPLLYSRLYKRIRTLTVDLTHAVSLLDDIKAYHREYREVPPTPFIPTEIAEIGLATNEENRPHVLRIEEAYARPSELRPTTTLRSLTSIGAGSIMAAPVAGRSAADGERMASYRRILSRLAVENGPLSSLAADGILMGREGIVSEEFLSANREEHLRAMLTSYREAAATTETREEVRRFSESMTAEILKGNAVLRPHAAQIVGATSMFVGKFFGLYGIDDPSDRVKIENSCEWAFLKKERVTLELLRPKYRGPLEANSVSPKSKLTLTETETLVSRSASHTLASTGDDLSEYTSISSQVKEKMGVLFDYGSNLGQTMSEQGYTQDHVKDVKRSRVETALREISQQNTAASMSAQSRSSSRRREYETEGKDALYSTTELSFEVFSPVKVRHRLEAISAVWAPRITNPFSGLRQLLSGYYQKAYADYILENYVIDPLEPIPSYESVTRVTQDTAAESDPGTFTKTVTFKLTANEISTGHLLGEDIRLEFHQHCDWYENCYDEDDRWMKVESVDRHGGDSWVDVTVKYHVDNVIGNDPDRTYIRVSIDKYKATEAYRQELKNYAQTVNKTNPARRNAIKAQARKYAALKRDELIRKHESNNEQLRDYAFTSLMKKMFANQVPVGNWSYYQGIIKSCIDWERARMDPEPADVASLYETSLSPYHFLNVQALRFFLPINPDAEKVFFTTMKRVTDASWRALFQTVERYITGARASYEGLSEEAKLLDSYDSELILGRHLEAVLSKQSFAEP